MRSEESLNELMLLYQSSGCVCYTSIKWRGHEYLQRNAYRIELEIAMNYLIPNWECAAEYQRNI